MIDAVQLPLLDLPEVPNVTDAPATEPAAEPVQSAPRGRTKQLSLDIRLYVVRSSVGECTVQAASAAAAKYRAFKAAKAMGMYCYEGGFLAFVSGGVRVSEVRQ